MNYEDYIIRLNEVSKNGPEAPADDVVVETASGKPKRITRIRSFLGRALKKPLEVDFSRDAKSSFTTFPGYQRPYLKRD